MITYSIFDDTGNLVEWWHDDRAESLATFVRFISQDAADMAWFAHDDNGTIIESLVYDAKPGTPVIIAQGTLRELAAAPARPRGRTLAEAKADYNRREAMQAEMKRVIEDDLDDWAEPSWESDHFCGVCGDPVNVCRHYNPIDESHAY